MAVAFDAVGPGAAGAGLTGTTTPFTWLHSCSGANRLLVVGVCVSPSGSDAGISLAVTYNGVSMTAGLLKHANNATAGYAQVFTLVAPATGSNTVSVAITGNAGLEGLECGSVSFTGVDQTTPTGNTATAAGSGVTIANSVAVTAGNMSVELACAGSGAGNTTQTLAWLLSRSTASAAGGGGMAYSTSSGTVSYSRTVTSDFWASILLEVAAVSGVAPSMVRPVLDAPAPSVGPARAAAPVVVVSRDVTPLQPSAQPWGPRVARPTFGPPQTSAPAALVQQMRDVTPLQPSSPLPLPDVATVRLGPGPAPAALVTRVTADPASGTMLPLVLDDRAPVTRPVPAPPALLARSVDVTPLQPSDSPPAVLVARALRGPSPAALPVLVDVAVVETLGPQQLLPGRAPQTPAFVAQPVLTRLTADPTSTTDTPTLPLVGRGAVLPAPAAAAMVYSVRDVTPLQLSASPPLVLVAPAGRLSAGPVAAVTARSTADPLLDTRTPLLAVQLAQAPAVPSRPWVVRVTFDAPPPDTLPRPLVVPALAAGRPAPLASLEVSPPPSAETPPRPLVVRVLLAGIGAARALLGRAPFDGTAPLVVRGGRGVTGSRLGPGTGLPDAHGGPGAATGSRWTAAAGPGTRTGPGGATGTRRQSGAGGGQ